MRRARKGRHGIGALRYVRYLFQGQTNKKIVLRKYLRGTIL